MQYKKSHVHSLWKIIVIFLLLVINSIPGLSQCPTNIDFETGTFDGWTCYLGSVAFTNGQNIITLHPVAGPVADEHTMLSYFPGDGLDEYCGFPKNCPNGSGHSIKLGNDKPGGLAEGLSYTFTIPPTSNVFSITYSYAVVFEDPNHPRKQQPRLEIEVMDMTDNTVINCFSFSFIAYPTIPGFVTAPANPGHAAIRYKDWTTNTVRLNGYEGKTVRFFARTADCTYGIHFGYAYLDVSSKCENVIVGETYCADDTAVNISAPSGYELYNWYNSSFSQLLSTGQVLHIQPPPPAGTTYAVELIPYDGYGCQDTLKVELQDTLTAKADAGPDVISCNLNPVQLGVTPITGMLYNWKPSYGLSDPNISNPIALTDRDTTYILSIRSIGGGCSSSDTVKVSVRNIDNSLKITGDSVYCVGSGSPPTLSVLPGNDVQWYKDGLQIPGATGFTYTVNSTDIYYASLISTLCSAPIPTKKISINFDTIPAGIRYPEVTVAYNFPIKLHARNLNNAVIWKPDISLDDPTSITPYFRSINSRLYTIEIKDRLGCKTVDTQYVKTYKEIAIYVPTAFTPNGDGTNDYLRPLLLGFEKVNYFRVYNRWGKLMFETKSDLPGWGGRVRGQMQEPQTVVWTIEAVDIDGKIHFRKGTSLLMH